MTISIGELQKNISIIKNAKEPIIVIDKKSKKRIAVIEPIKDNDLDLFEELMSFEKKIDREYSRKDFEKIYSSHLKAKYGLN
ncbi:hypothetical protein FE773_00905 [Caminibacter mediatlanticus TB-2]|uniref:Antitoxin n=1 Tax=Caminibacter mediatlanticus TB-2 TaxID=391592 RepID=A0ABX5VAG9_9BACT|nr:hypothetical protein [Caminibacter mediatlanticus]QCT93786.1 hypothetical protein FE773_00905 [Caminibacter mediatlanticus TB-2]